MVSRIFEPIAFSLSWHTLEFNSIQYRNHCFHIWYRYCCYIYYFISSSSIPYSTWFHIGHSHNQPLSKSIQCHQSFHFPQYLPQKSGSSFTTFSPTTSLLVPVHINNIVCWRTQLNFVNLQSSSLYWWSYVISDFGYVLF